MKQVILDCDGVLSDFVKSYLSTVLWVTGRQYTHEDVTRWDIWDVLGLTTDEKKHVNDEMDYFFCQTMHPIKGAFEGFERLDSIANVYIATTPWQPCEGWTHARESWLKHHFNVGYKRVIHTHTKSVLRGDIMVDDNIDNVRSWAADNPNGKAVLWDQPWNRGDKWDGIRTNSWDVLCSLAEGK